MPFQLRYTFFHQCDMADMKSQPNKHRFVFLHDSRQPVLQYYVRSLNPTEAYLEYQSAFSFRLQWLPYHFPEETGVYFPIPFPTPQKNYGFLLFPGTVPFSEADSLPPNAAGYSIHLSEVHRSAAFVPQQLPYSFFRFSRYSCSSCSKGTLQKLSLKR